MRIHAVALALAASCSSGVPTPAPGAGEGASCTACHGGSDGSAPPRSAHGATSTADVGVGAHQTHLTPGPFHKAVACDECHVVPDRTDSPGHVDADHADVVFGGLARVRGAAPAWDRSTVTCSSTYCHGGMLAGGSNTAPAWTTVDGSQVACGTCHGVPPPVSSGHPAVADAGTAACAACHPGTVRPDGAIDVPGGQHGDGVVQVGAAACAGCHGDVTRLPAEIAAAPPKDTRGNTATTASGVGAHQRHLVAGTVRGPIACTECHVQRTNLLDHPSGTVDLTWGALAKAGGAVPAWNAATARCSGTYCHGATLGGGTATAPIWTQVDGKQNACTSCHGVPPPAPHVADPNCGACHLGYTATSVNVATHVDGYVQLDGQGCTSCHGDASRAAAIQAAPPGDLAGNTATTAIGVGAHLAHLTGTTLRAPIACSECHAPVTSTAHAKGQNLKVQMAWGPLATAGGSYPVWDRATATCASTYCHGGTLAGGTQTAPVWTTVDGSQAACGACHGIPPPAPHVARRDCATCHPGFTATSVNLATHLNGVVDAATMRCTTCHGDATRAVAAIQAAPPADTKGGTATTALGVGAHQKHLVDGVLRKAIACAECHPIQTSSRHADGKVDMAWGPLASAGGAAPAWNSATATCTSYCHGATLTGGKLTAPVWTKANGTQAVCGSCHGIPPPAPHVQDLNCAGCHAGYSTTTVDVTTHVDGMVQSQGSCTSCHGDATRAPAIASAPPLDTKKSSATTAPGVGAHQVHLAGGPLRKPVACTECHVVPANMTAHPSGTLDMTFGPLARTGGAVPRWNATALTCSGTYCHGATLVGGAATTPLWTKIDGTQTACTSCHAIPPATTSHAGMTAATACGPCHTGYTATTLNAALHLNGIMDAQGTCTSCHGDATRAAAIAPAPPKDTKGNSATTWRGVGAHQAHLAGGATGPATACSECHVVPTVTAHSNGTVDMTFGPLARTAGAAPSWSGTALTCSGTYCHGATLKGGTITVPSWTKVDGTQVACGTCHGVPPPAPHVQNAACGGCHAGYTATTVSVATHVDGVIQTSAMACTSCHGDGARTLVAGADAQTRAAPPVDTRGASATTLRSVGTHLAHLNKSGAMAAPTACSECHVVPTTMTHSNGAVTVTFGARAKTGGVAPTWNGTTCAGTYCHGNHTNGTKAAPGWTAAGTLACTSCHPMPPPTSSHTKSHPGGNACNVCHRDTDAAGSRITSPAQHVDGKVQGLCTDCH